MCYVRVIDDIVPSNREVDVRVAPVLILLPVLLPGLASADEPVDAAPQLLLGPGYGAFAPPTDEDSVLDYFGLRLAGQTFWLTMDGDSHGPSTRDPAEFQQPDAMVDFYPFRNGLRFSGGFLYATDPWDQPVATPTPLALGTLPFTPSQPDDLSGAIEFSQFTPYWGMGLQSSFWSGRLELAVDLGLSYEGPLASEPTNQDDQGSASTNQAVADEELDEAGADLRFLGFSPRAGLSLKLRF